MNTKEIAFQILEIAYNHAKATGDSLLKTNEFMNQFSNYPENDVILAFEYLNEKNCIEVKTYKGAKFPPFIKIKSAGYDWLNDDAATANTVHQTFNFKNNYGAVGTNTNFTINNSFEFEELSRLINENTDEGSADRKELEKFKTFIQECIEQSKPLEKSSLAHFSTSIQKHSWIAGPVATILLKYLVS